MNKKIAKKVVVLISYPTENAQKTLANKMQKLCAQYQRSGGLMLKHEI